MPAEIAAQIVAHTQSGYPDEVCGLMAGRTSITRTPRPRDPPPLNRLRLLPGQRLSHRQLVRRDRPVFKGFGITVERVREIAIKSEHEGDPRGLLPKGV